MGLVRNNAVFQSLRLMTTSPSPKRRRTGVLAVVALVAVSVLVMGGWFIRRAAWEGAVTERLGGYAAAPLPAPDAPVDSELADLGADMPAWLVKLVLGDHAPRLRAFSAAHPAIRMTSSHMWLDFFDNPGRM